jgi:2',3'-cyclic-nucleotide 2'-phosphodiesterase (5'-nucleotidase family)
LDIGRLNPEWFFRKETLMKGIIRPVSLLVVALLIFPASILSQSVFLTILHTNDTHGHLMPFSYPESVSAGSELAGLETRRDIGGIARRATMVARLRDELKQKGAVVWLVDAGDFSDGTPFSTEYHGEADIAVMNTAKYDFGTLGNHEFNNSLAVLNKLLEMPQYPILCANAIDKATNRPLSISSEVRELGPLKIGIFGLVSRDASTYPAAKEGVVIEDEINTAREMVKDLQSRADVIVLISHAGETMDRRIAAAVPGIDVIIGGHSHTRLSEGDFVWRSDQLKPREVNGTVIVQAHQWGGELGRLDLLFEKDEMGSWHIDRYRARLVPITSDIPEDAETAKVLNGYWGKISARFGEVLGEASGDFIARGDDLAQYNLFTDSIREAFGVEFELENIGGIRSDLMSGKITRGDLVTMDPFNNTVVTFQVKGKKLKEILQKFQPAVSGIQYRMEANILKEAKIGGHEIEDNRVYSGATNSFAAKTILKGIVANKDTGKSRVDTVIGMIRKKGTIKPVYDGRRVILD